jgi:hypothetical protein
VIARRAGIALAALVGLLACGQQTWSLDADSGAGSSGSEAGAPVTGCVSDGDCHIASLHCDPVSGQCFACVDDSQCTQAGLPRCDSASHQCVQCGVAGDCTSGQVCEPTSHKCLPSCADGGACPSGLTCSQPRGVCVACTTNADCVSAGSPVCDTGSGQCVQCVYDTQCAFPAPRCNQATGRCVQCLTAADCEENVCDPVTSTCLQNEDGGGGIAPDE